MSRDVATLRAAPRVLLHARYMRIADLDEAEATADELRSIVRAWCDMRDADG